ncbi:MAG: polysaccharide deacetylase family protein [Bacteroidales bacterium]|nr:polysaccharide deacetylase family protein [Bacteroidales bacterium]
MKKGFILLFFSIIIANVSWAGDTLKYGRYLYSEKYFHFIAGSDTQNRNAFVFCVNAPGKIAALTFDDGPSHLTPALLKVLREQKCPATFFLLAEKLTKKQAAWYYDTLFTLGIHGYTHVRINETSLDTINIEFEKAVKRFKSLYIPPVYYRPTFGGFNDEIVEQMDKYQLKGILWNIDSYDWNGYTGDSLVNRVVGNVTPGSIILFHEKTPPWDIVSVIKELRTAGYRIVSLEELLKYPANRPEW